MLVFFQKQILVFIPLLIAAMLYSNSYQLMTFLLNLEMFVLMNFLGVVVLSSQFEVSPSLNLIFMCVMVCEAMVGIAILILMTRNKGNSYLAY